MPLHFPLRRISNLGSQIRERTELHEARRLKKPLNQNEVLKASKLQKISDWAFEIKSAIPLPDRKNKSAARKVSGIPPGSVLAGKQPVHEYNRTSGARYSPTYASMMSALSSSSSHQSISNSSNSRSSSYQKEFHYKHGRSKVNDEDDLVVRPLWDPPDVGPSTWWKYPPPGYHDMQIADQTMNKG